MKIFVTFLSELNCTPDVRVVRAAFLAARAAPAAAPARLGGGVQDVRADHDQAGHHDLGQA